MENQNQNLVQLVGKLVALKKVWSSADHVIYEGILQIIRDSGASDFIPILFNDICVEVESFVEVKGQFRSRDVDNNGKLKVELYVYAQEISKIKNIKYHNDIFITGFICKKPVMRNTPSGKQIADVLIACNYNKDKTAYIPCIAWGKYARKAGKYNVGTEIKIYGRLQSRKYIKEINGIKEERTAYELSISSIEEIYTNDLLDSLLNQPEYKA